MTTVAGLAIAAVATLTPVRDGTPGAGAWWCLHCGSFALVDAIGNVVLFIPAGVGLGVLARRVFPAVVGLALVSLAIEAMQVWLIPGRDSSLRDVITNTMGGAAGIGLVRHWRVWVVPRSAVASRLALVAAGGWAATLGATAVLMHPSTPPGDYWGQRGGDSTRATQVAHVSVNGQAIRLGPLTDPGAVLAALNSGDVRIEVTLAPGAGRTSGALARVSHRRTEAFRLAHRGDDLLFTLRMRSADMRLRTPIVRLRDGLPRAAEGVDGSMSGAGDTLRVRASLRNGVLRLEREGGPAVSAGELALAPTTGWALFLPTALAVAAPPWVLNGLWVAALLFPVGYWTAAARRMEKRRGTVNDARRARALSITVGAIVIGALALVPALSGTPWPSGWDWCCALAGAAAGAVAATRFADSTR